MTCRVKSWFCSCRLCDFFGGSGNMRFPPSGLSCAPRRIAVWNICMMSGSCHRRCKLSIFVSLTCWVCVSSRLMVVCGQMICRKMYVGGRGTLHFVTDVERIDENLIGRETVATACILHRMDVGMLTCSWLCECRLRTSGSP